MLAKDATRSGRFTDAEAHYDETVEITRAIGGYAPFYELLKVDLYAWRGQEDQTRHAATQLAEGAAAIGSGPPVAIAQLALATLAMGTGRYADALTVIRPLIETNIPGWTCQALSVAVEAAIRTDDRDLAERCLHQLHERSTAVGNAWGLGLNARSHALVATSGDTAEALYLDAIAHLEGTSIITELAHTRLLYGEWLRRQGRRQDARA